MIQPSTIKVRVLLLILLHPHTYKEEGINNFFWIIQKFLLIWNKPIQTEIFETLVHYNKGICPNINSLLNMKSVLQLATSIPIRSLFVLLFNFNLFLLVTYNLFAGLPCLFLLHCYEISSVTQRRGHPLHLYWHIRSLTIGIAFVSLLMDKKRITWKLNRKLNKNPYISMFVGCGGQWPEL